MRLGSTQSQRAKFGETVVQQLTTLYGISLVNAHIEKGNDSFYPSLPDVYSSLLNNN